MSESVCIFSTSVALKAGASFDKVHEIAQECFDGYGVVVEELHPAPSDGTTGPMIAIEMETTDGYPQTLYQNALSFAKEVGPMLAGGLEITIRTDAMNDERDQVVVAGPSPEAIDQFERVQAINEAIEALRLRAPDLAELLKQTRDGVQAPPVKLIIDMKDGIFGEVTASAPVDLVLCDNDIEGDDQSIHQFVFGQKVFLSDITVDVDPLRVKEWEGEIATSEDYRQKELDDEIDSIENQPRQDRQRG